MNTVLELKNLNFSQLTLQEKLTIKEKGRPVPNLNLVQTTMCKGKARNRIFNKDVYSKYGWACGCELTNRIYCFPCLMFACDKDKSSDTWTKSGFCDLGHLKQKMDKHEQSKMHMNAELEFQVLGKYEIRQQLDCAFRRNIEQQNIEVSKNRHVLSQIIECIKFCGIFELALRGHDETEDSVNPGIFRGLIDFTSELDTLLKDHLKRATVFKGTSKEIQNDLLQCMLDVCRDEIKTEIQQADFLSVIADETSDVSSQYQMIIVFRYLLSNGKPVERFWTFKNPCGHDAQALATCVKDALEEVVSDKTKVISQSYDGANVMSGAHSGVQEIVKQIYPYAHYVHCYAHKLNLIMAQATSQNTQVRIFFADLTEIPQFFANSPQRVNVLDEVVGRRIPSASNIRWNFKSRTVETVYEHRESLMECLEIIENSSKQVNTITQARGLRFKMEQPVFLFWLEFFHHIMPHVDILYQQLQKRIIDTVTVNSAISSFKSAVESVRNTVDDISEEPSSTKRRRQETPASRRVAAKEVCDVISVQAKERFSFTGHLMASNLFSSENFVSFNRNFPEDSLFQACQAYPFVDSSKLRTELEIMYMREDFRNVACAVDLLEFIIQNNLQKIFSEALKVLKVLTTTPMTTSEAERCFSTLKRIKTFLRSTMSQERLTALAMLSIEKQLVRSIPNFNEKVIDKFSQQKDRRMNFIHRKLIQM